MAHLKTQLNFRYYCCIALSSLALPSICLAQCLPYIQEIFHRCLPNWTQVVLTKSWLFPLPYQGEPNSRIENNQMHLPMQQSSRGFIEHSIPENSALALMCLPHPPSSSTALPVESWVDTTSQCTFCIGCLETKTVSATQTPPVDHKGKATVTMPLRWTNEDSNSVTHLLW